MSTLEHYLRTDSHAYFVPVNPKSLLETLNLLEFIVTQFGVTHPGFSAGGDIKHHLSVIKELRDECKRQRPTGSDGKHGNLHTAECGCEDR